MTTATAMPVAAGTATAKPFKTIRHSAALAKRSLIKTMRTPEALLDVTLQPIIFLALFTYVFGGAIAGIGQQQAYLQYLLPGILAQTIAMSATAIGVNMNTDISKGVFDRFRILPIARSAPLIGAVLADFVRYALVAVITLSVGYAMGFRIHTNPLEAAAALLVAVAFALAMSWVSVFLGMVARTPGAVQGMMILLVLPLSFGSNTFVQTSDAAGLDAGLRQGQPDHPPGRRLARAVPRRAGRRPHAVDVRLDRRPDRGVHAAGAAGLRTQGLTPGQRGGDDVLGKPQRPRDENLVLVARRAFPGRVAGRVVGMARELLHQRARVRVSLRSAAPSMPLGRAEQPHRQLGSPTASA